MQDLRRLFTEASSSRCLGISIHGQSRSAGQGRASPGQGRLSKCEGVASVLALHMPGEDLDGATLTCE